MALDTLKREWQAIINLQKDLFAKRLSDFRGLEGVNMSADTQMDGSVKLSFTGIDTISGNSMEARQVFGKLMEMILTRYGVVQHGRENDSITFVITNFKKPGSAPMVEAKKRKKKRPKLNGFGPNMSIGSGGGAACESVEPQHTIITRRTRLS